MERNAHLVQNSLRINIEAYRAHQRRSRNMAFLAAAAGSTLLLFILIHIHI
jgi:hypothetical protein